MGEEIDSMMKETLKGVQTATSGIYAGKFVKGENTKKLQKIKEQQAKEQQDREKAQQKEIELKNKEKRKELEHKKQVEQEKLKKQQEEHQKEIKKQKQAQAEHEKEVERQKQLQIEQAKKLQEENIKAEANKISPYEIKVIVEMYKTHESIGDTSKQYLSRMFDTEDVNEIIYKGRSLPPIRLAALAALIKASESEALDLAFFIVGLKPELIKEIAILLELTGTKKIEAPAEKPLQFCRKVVDVIGDINKNNGLDFLKQVEKFLQIPHKLKK